MPDQWPPEQKIERCHQKKEIGLRPKKIHHIWFYLKSYAEFYQHPFTSIFPSGLIIFSRDVKVNLLTNPGSNGVKGIMEVFSNGQE